MPRNFGLSNREAPPPSSNVLPFLPTRVGSAPRATEEDFDPLLFFSPQRHWALQLCSDLFAIAAWVCLTVFTASAIVAAIFMLMFLRL